MAERVSKCFNPNPHSEIGSSILWALSNDAHHEHTWRRSVKEVWYLTLITKYVSSCSLQKSYGLLLVQQLLTFWKTITAPHPPQSSLFYLILWKLIFCQQYLKHAHKEFHADDLWNVKISYSMIYCIFK